MECRGRERESCVSRSRVIDSGVCVVVWDLLRGA